MAKKIFASVRPFFFGSEKSGARDSTDNGRGSSPRLRLSPPGKTIERLPTVAKRQNPVAWTRGILKILAAVALLSIAACSNIEGETGKQQEPEKKKIGALSIAAYSNIEGETGKPREPQPKKIGVLLVNHGSRSERWRKALLDVEDAVRDAVLADGTVSGIKTAFMEYVEPSIATRLKEFDREGYTDVVLVPVFLTVSPHSFDDIPTIIGLKEAPLSLQQLKLEKIERYAPKAKVTITPLLDFTDILEKNILRRCRALSKDGKNEGLVLIAYGEEVYEKEWIALLDKIAGKVHAELGIDEHTHAWCGHIANYDPGKTTAAIEAVLKNKKKAIVVPVLVAFDEMFQVKIIGGGVQRIADHEQRVIYKPDAILPDDHVNQWVRDIALKAARKIAKR